MKINLILITTLIISLLSLNAKHACIHDDLPNTRLLTSTAKDGKRMLSAEREQIRITFDFIDSKTITPERQAIKQKLMNVCTLAINFLSKSLKVNRLMLNNKFPQHQKKCLYTTVPERHKTEGIPNSDLHILIGFFYNNSSSTIAYASSCLQDDETKRPLYGATDFNLAFLDEKATDADFENYFETVVHELTHILGFSHRKIYDFIDPATGKSYNEGSKTDKTPIEKEVINGKDTLWVTTPKVQQMAREHYGCPTIKGIQLENDYGGGSKNSHWERSTFENEYMNAIHSGHDASITKFTFALLEDSGWYTPTYEYLDEVSWGKGKGCDFLYTCDPKKHREFDNSQNYCSYYHNFIGYHSIPDDGEERRKQTCHAFQSVRTECTDVRRKDDAWNGNTFSESSKCFESNIIGNNERRSNSEGFRCLNYQCNENGGIDVYVKGQRYPIDRATNRVNVIPRGKNDSLEGYIQGPEDWDAFCNSYPKACPKFCSSNGYCVGNQCHCGKDYAGVACDVYCPGDNYAQEGKCLYSKQCPPGTTFQKTSKSCVLTPKRREPCKQGEVEHNHKCVSECPVSHFKGAEFCEYCIYNCEKCSQSTTCDKCVDGKILSSDRTKCRDCVEGCNSCTGNKCHSCEQGYIYQYDSDPLSRNWIISCVITCPNTHFMANERDCLPCRSNCVQCTSYSSCLACESGYYLNQGYCQKIECRIDNCQSCLNSYECKECKKGYEIKYVNKQWQCIAKQVECQPQQYVQNNQCYDCSTNCTQCTGESSCQACQKGYQIKNGYCQKKECRIDNCQECENDNDCKECKKGYEKQQANGVVQCIKQKTNIVCKAWQYVQNSECKECAYQCYECSDGNTCDSCYSGYYHDKQQKDCLKCPDNCSSCINSTICKYCRNNTVLLQQEDGSKICVEKCPPGYKINDHQDIKFRECQKN